jgi:DMSO/TMAO reductase YedYZ molybdopterin-dependent catalytic subunit
VSDDLLPPRQQATRRWPLVGERDPEPFDADTWRLSVSGLVERPAEYSFADLLGLGLEERSGTIHCVTRWSRPDSSFEGVPLRLVLDAAGVLPEARFVRFASGRGHDTTLPLELALADVLLAHRFNDGPVEPGHGGPLRSVIFSRYFYKSVKWLRVVELLAEDRPGFWERTAGYHNDANPWKEQRYAISDLDRREVERLLGARDLSGRELRGVELEGRDLGGFNFRDSTMRDARLARADLRGADFTGVNLSNADLRGADLRDACFDGADLDGADFRGANLEGLRVAASSMACTTFAGPGGDDAASLKGADFRGADVGGLLEDQLHLVRELGCLEEETP